MGTVLDYLEQYSEYTFQEKPMTEVDSVVLCQLSYLKFDGMVPGVKENKGSVTLKSLAEHTDYDKLFADTRFEKPNRALFQKMLQSRRYRNLKLNCYINIVEEAWETQFSAITYILEDGTVYLAYRGTDESIVGWKEDFNMALLTPVPAQEYSVKYLHMVTSRFHRPFYVGGHSKGGNLAVYSAMKCIPQVQDRIIKIYSLDGPGFRPEILTDCNYDMIAGRVVKILPHSSMVGILFESDPRFQVVESRSFGLLQHDLFNWKVKDDCLVRANDIYERRRRTGNAVNQWILSLEEDQLRLFVDTLYKVVMASETDNLIDFVAAWKKSMNGMAAALKEVDEETAEVIRGIFKSLMEMVGGSMKREATAKGAVPFGLFTQPKSGKRSKQSV